MAMQLLDGLVKMILIMTYGYNDIVDYHFEMSVNLIFLIFIYSFSFKEKEYRIEDKKQKKHIIILLKYSQ